VRRLGGFVSSRRRARRIAGRRTIRSCERDECDESGERRLTQAGHRVSETSPMKKLHRPEFFGWSRFDEKRNIDFHSVLWVRPEGNVAFDPLPLSSHDEAHLAKLGGASFVIITNSDHVRDTARFVELTGAKIAGPRGEMAGFPIPCSEWLAEGDVPVPDLEVLEMRGSKTPGELALLIGGHTLITGDLVRAHRAGALTLIPNEKLSDRAAAVDSVRRLLDLAKLQAILVGDGWPIFRDGHRVLRELVAELGN